jgi:hypothetical protein
LVHYDAGIRSLRENNPWHLAEKSSPPTIAHPALITAVANNQQDGLEITHRGQKQIQAKARYWPKAVFR